jgi:hypothetical protein
LHEDDGADFLVAQQGSRTRARDHDGVPFVKYSVVVYEHWTGATVVQLLSEILIAREFVELAAAQPPPIAAQPRYGSICPEAMLVVLHGPRGAHP